MSRGDPEALRLAQAAGAALARRDFEAARQAASALLVRNPLDPNGRQILGIVALEMGDPAGARQHLEQANKVAPNQPGILNALGAAARRLGDLKAARAAFTRTGELGLIDGWRNLGNLELQARQYAAAIAAFERGLGQKGNDAGLLAGAAQALEATHQLREAAARAEKALVADPNSETARLILAQVRLREKRYDDAEAAALRLARADRASPINRALAWGAVGEARDRRDEIDAAFEAFAISNRLLLEQYRPLLAASQLLYHPDGVRRMIEVVGAADVAAWRAPPTAQTPVFLVGFPRSGTTLLDQILSSHSGVVCIEEREHFANALAGVINDPVKLNALAALGDAEIEAARADYWRRVRGELAIPEGALVVDRMPLNIIVLPLIRRVFPDAKIILALRDPRDVVLSCFQQRFDMNAAMVQFLELERAAAYYDVVMRLMRVSRELLGLTLHDVRYEDVVENFETTVRSLCAFLGIAFEPAMTTFDETARARPIATPSARQVVQPIYNRSVGRWRLYADHMRPVLTTLETWAKELGYA